MKAWISTIFYLVCTVFLLGACSGSRRVEQFKLWAQPNGKIKVLSTIVQIGDLVQEIGGEGVDSLVLIQGELDPHSYELVKGDDEKFSIADIAFYNGLGLEHGASLHTALLKHPSSVNLGAWVRGKQPEQILQKNQLADPHIWMDLSLWKETIDPIVEKLSALDPEGEPIYRERAKQLALKMDLLHAKMQKTMQQVPPERRYLVTSHDAFHYFTRAYLAEPSEGEAWKERFAAPEGLSPDGQLSPVDLAQVVRYLEKHRISVLFPESNVSRDSIQKIVSAGLELGLSISICSEVLYGDAMGTDEGKSYFDSMLHNAEVIAQYLGREQ